MADIQPIGFTQFGDKAAAFASNAQAVGPVGNVTGGNSQGGVQQALNWGDGGGPSNAIPQFFNELLAPRINAIKKQKFYEGLADAREGRALTEIQEETPWFARVFGQTNHEAGATVYTANEAVSTLMTEMQNNMSELRTKTTHEVGQWLNNKSNEMFTGDVLGDAVIQKQLIDQSGPLMELHAKARYAWQQDNLVQGQLRSAMAASRQYDSSMRMLWQLGKDHPDQPPDPNKRVEMETLFANALVMPDGQDGASAVKFVESFVDNAAREGNWHSLNFLEQSGIKSMLPQDAQDRMEKKLVTARSKWQTNMAMSPDMAPATMIASAVRMGVVSPRDGLEQLTQFNREFTARTGYQDPWFDQSDINSLIGSGIDKTYSAMQQRLDHAFQRSQRAQDKLDKEAAAAQATAMYAKQAAMGELGVASLMNGFDSKQADAALVAMVEQSPTQGMAALVSNFTNPKKQYVSQTLKDQLVNRVASGAGLSFNDSIDSAHKVWKEMFGMKNPDGSDSGVGPAMASQYFGEYADDMFAYDSLLRNGLGPEDAYLKVFGPEAIYGRGDLRGGEGEKKNKEALNAAVNELSPGFFGRLFGAESLTESSKRVIAHHSSRFYERMLKQSPNLSPEIIAQRSVESFVNDGGEIAGKYAWQNPRGQARISDELKIPPDVFGKVFDSAVTNRFRKQGLAVDNDTEFEIIRIGNDKDGPRMLITGYNSDGVMKGITLNSKDFVEFRDAYANENYKRANFKPNDVQAPVTAPKAGRNTL